MTGEGKTYRPSKTSLDAVSIAVAAYKNFGQRSVVSEWRALAEAGYRSRVTEWSGQSAVTQDPRPKPKEAERNSRPTEHSPPVFVLGNQKSGTTAIAALLANCIGEKFISDVLHSNKLQLKDVLNEGPSFAALVSNHSESFKGVVVKDNDFTFVHPALARAFPDARFVFIVRDPRQNIRSVLNRLTLPGNLESLSQEQYTHLSTKLPGWHTIVTGSSFGPETGHYIDVLADRWVRANQVYLDASDRMTLVRYEDFDAAKRPAIEALAAELGFTAVNDISKKQDRQYQPLGDRSIAPGTFFGQANLERLERRCATMMPAFGYEPSRGDLQR